MSPDVGRFVITDSFVKTVAMSTPWSLRGHLSRGTTEEITRELMDVKTPTMTDAMVETWAASVQHRANAPIHHGGILILVLMVMKLERNWHRVGMMGGLGMSFQNRYQDDVPSAERT